MNSVLLEHVSCDYCGSNIYKVRYRKPDDFTWLNQFEFPVVECCSCGLVFVNPRPTEQSMQLYYPSNYHDNRDTESHTARYEIQTHFLPKLTDEKVLDIGCARGDFLIFLKKTYPGIELHGIDYYSESVKDLDIKFYKRSLDESSLPGDSFDLITAWAVFEHLHRPGNYFKEVYRILKPGGKFVFLVTNSESLYGKKAYIEDIPRHTYHYSKQSVRNYAEKYGFHFSNIWYDDSVYDGRGTGTYYHSLQKIAGVTWEKRFHNQLTAFQRFMGRVGKKIDRWAFKSHWESEQQKSGIIIVEFTKPK
jgi:SAM-dependent methyltransferase